MQTRPDFAARHLAGITAFNTDPTHAEARRAKAQKAARTKAANPETMAKLREVGRIHGRPNIERTRSAASRAKAGAAISATKLAHVPAAYRPLYRELRSPHCPPEEALRLVLDQQRRDDERAEQRERDRVAALSPFERMQERVASGARLVERVPMRRADHAYTLGGVTGEIG